MSTSSESAIDQTVLVRQYPLFGVRSRLDETLLRRSDEGMDVTRIQREVRRLPARQRKKLTAWMVTQYPALSVKTLLAKAERGQKAGAPVPLPPTEANVPTGKALAHALKVAGKLTLRK